VRDHGRFARIGSTRDDAAGEAFDKVARLLGLPHPGGPGIDRAAAAYDGPGERFPIASLGGSFDFSFSGLKTAVARHVAGHPRGLDEESVGRIAKGFQSAVVRALVANVVRATRIYGVRQVVVGGGVAANTGLRCAMGEAGAAHGFGVTVPPSGLCTDNAAMIAAVGCYELVAGRVDDLSLDAMATSPLP
jgi:N6-L-threonylcarbamoyladenine synthase